MRFSTSNSKKSIPGLILFITIIYFFGFFITPEYSFFFRIVPASALAPHSQAKFSLARRLFQDNKILEAKKILVQLKKNNPDDSGIADYFRNLEIECENISLKYLDMADNAYRDNQYQESINYYKLCLKYDPKNQEAREGRKMAMDDYREITISSGINSKRAISSSSVSSDKYRGPKLNQILIHYKLANRYLKHKAYDDAIREFEVVLKLDPSNAGAKNMLKKLKHDNETYRPYSKGIELYKKGRYKEALKELSPIYSWNQNFLDITFYIGSLHHHLKNHKLCLEILGRYLLNPHNVARESKCHILRASSYLSLFQSKRALYEFGLAWHKSPEMFNMFSNSKASASARDNFNLSWILTFKWIIIMLICQIVMMVALQIASIRFFKMSSGEVLPKILLKAKKFQSEQKFDKALKYYRQANALAPDNYSIYYSTGLIYNKMNRLSEAIDSFETVLKIKPDYLRASYNLAQLYSKSSMYRECITILRNSLEVDLKVICPGAEFDDIISNKILYEQTSTKLLFLLEQKLEAQQIV